MSRGEWKGQVSGRRKPMLTRASLGSWLGRDIAAYDIVILGYLFGIGCPVPQSRLIHSWYLVTIS